MRAHLGIVLLTALACGRAPRENVGGKPSATATGGALGAPTSSAVAAASGSTDPPRVDLRPGLSFHAEPGLPRLDVFQNTARSDGKDLLFGASWADDTPPTRARVDELLKTLWTQASQAYGTHMPSRVQMCLFPKGVRLWDLGRALGCVDVDPDEQAEGDEVGPEYTNNVRMSLREEADRLEAIRKADFGGARRPKATIEAGAKRITLAFPYVEPRTDNWAAHLTYGAAIAPALLAVFEFFGKPDHEGKRLRFVGTWNDKTVVSLDVPSDKAFMAMKPWDLREAFRKAGLRDDLVLTTPEQEKVVRAEFEQAATQLPPSSVRIDPVLTRDASASSPIGR